MFEDLLYTLELTIKQKITNLELKYFQFFLEMTDVHPKHVIIIEKYLFYFVAPRDHFKASKKIGKLRRTIKNYKVIIIRQERTIIKLLFGVFPDLYVHDVKPDFNNITGEVRMQVYFTSFEERKIAVGSKGDYIKAVNELFQRHIIPIKVSCELVDEHVFEERLLT